MPSRSPLHALKSVRERDVLLDEYVWMRSCGVSNQWMHLHLKMTRDQLLTEMDSARKAGDPRAATWGHY